MSTLESALRQALAKGDASDPAFRRKVYTAAANAMERSAAGDATGQGHDALVARRRHLADIISRIEADITGKPPVLDPPRKPDMAAQGGAAAPAIAPQSRTGQSTVKPDQARMDRVAQAPGSAPSLRAEPRRTPAPVAAAPDDGKPKRRVFSKMLGLSTAVGLVLVGFVFVVTTGAFQSAEDRDTSVPNPPARLEAENSDGTSGGSAPALAATGTAEERAAAEGWITVFKPSDPTTLALVGGAQGESRSDPFGDFMRIVTQGPDAQARFDIPVGVLLELRGKPAQVNIVARADDGNPTEMSVTCDLGIMGDCGRRRFLVGQAPTEYLFRVDLPDASAVNEPGALILRSDVSDQARPLNVLAVRLRAIE